MIRTRIQVFKEERKGRFSGSVNYRKWPKICTTRVLNSCHHETEASSTHFGLTISNMLAKMSFH